MKVSNNFVLLILAFILYVSLINIVFVYSYSITGNPFFVNVAPATKDLFLFVLILVIGLSALISGKLGPLPNPLTILMLLFFASIAIFFVISDASMSFRLYNVRRIAEWVLIIFTFSLIELSYQQFTFLLRATLNMSLFIFAFGVFGMLVPLEFWDVTMNLPGYWNARQYIDVSLTSITQAGGRAFSSDLYFLTGEVVRRMVSTYAEATTLGIFFTFVFVYSSFSRVIPFRWLYILTGALGGLLVFSKTFLLAAVVVLFVKLWKKVDLKLFYFGMFSLFCLSGYLFHYVGKIHGGLGHLFGFYTGFELLLDHPMGFGLGVAGNRGERAVGVINGLFGGESGLGNILAQLGVFGLFALAILHYVMKYFSTQFRVTRNPEFFAIFITTACWALTFFLSASSLGLTGNYIFFVFIGLLLNPGLTRTLQRQVGSD